MWGRGAVREEGEHTSTGPEGLIPKTCAWKLQESELRYTHPQGRCPRRTPAVTLNCTTLRCTAAGGVSSPSLGECKPRADEGIASQKLQ